MKNLNKYKNKNLYAHFSNYDKVEINDTENSASYLTPHGVYTYPIDYVISIGDNLPYGKDMNNIFILKLNGNIKNKNNYTKSDFNSDIQKLKKNYNTKIINKAKRNLKDYDIRSNIEALWYLTREYLEIESPDSIEYDAKKWREMFLSIGISGIEDLGDGFIQGSEPTQTVIFDINNIKIIDKINQSNIKETFKKFLMNTLIESNENDSNMRKSANKLYVDFYDKLKTSLKSIEDESYKSVLNFTIYDEEERKRFGDGIYYIYSEEEINEITDSEFGYSDLIIFFEFLDSSINGDTSQIGDGTTMIKVFVPVNIEDYIGRTIEDFDITEKIQIVNFMLNILIDNKETFRKTFVHEFIHYIDFDRASNYQQSKLNNAILNLVSGNEEIIDDSDEAYYGDPLEFNAYYNETISDIENELESLFEDDRYDQIKTILSPESFENFFNSLSFPNYYSQDNKYNRKIKKRVYQFWKSINNKYGEYIK